jgi:uncharacterized protein
MSLDTANGHRIADVDALRGFALFGILVVNIGWFASAYYGSGVSDPAHASAFDVAVRAFIAFAFESKFYLVFSFLFGYSFTLQMDSAARAGDAFRPRIVRRCVALWVIGLAHAVLLYHGDILTTYAVLGLVLFALRERDEDRALALAVWLLAVTALVWAALGAVLVASGVRLDDPELAQTVRATEAAYRAGGAASIAQRLDDLAQTAFVLAFAQAPASLAMFLAGYVAGRRRLFADVAALRARLGRIVRIGLAIGVPGAVVYALSAVGEGMDGWTMLAFALDIVTAPFLSAAYVALVLLALGAPVGERLRYLLAPAGRMALSNYLAQSAICAFVFTGYGLALVGRLAPWQIFALAVAIFAAQTIVSRWWLARHVYGPAEWVLRAATLGRLPAWRRAAASDDSTARE